MGAALQRRAGAARHDAVAWGYARGAAARGVDIIQNCPVTAIRREPRRRVTGVETAKGFIKAKKVAVSAAGHTSVVMESAGVRMPLESYPAAGAGLRADQADLPLRRHVEHRARLHQPVRQGRARHRLRHRPVRLATRQRGGLPLIEHTLAAICEIFPIFTPHAHAAQMGRHRRRDAGPLGDHRQDAGARPLRQLRLGHRRLQGDAGRGAHLRPHRRPRTSRIRSTRPSRWSASPPAG